MFNLSTQDVVLSIENAPLVNLNGILYQEYKDFFGKTFQFTGLENKNFMKLEGQYNLSRVRLDYGDLFMKQIRIFFMNTNITKSLEKKFKTKLKFSSADIWVDNKGYKLSPHKDDNRIKLALQIYLSNNSNGTVFYNENNEVLYTVPFKFNHGYALYNNSKSYHGVDEIQKNGRTSLYVRYS